jgi:hypothetical protein
MADIAHVVPEKSGLSPVEIDAVVEIAYLTIAADRRLANEEVAAFHGVLGRLRGAKVEQAELDRVLDDMYDRADKARRDVRSEAERDEEKSRNGYADERLRALAGKMGVPARELAYKVAYAMGLADMDSSDEEFELDLQLQDALEISNERAETLADEVMAVLNPSE